MRRMYELADNGDLYEHLKNNGNIVQEKYAVRDVISPCLNTLSYLHTLNIIHRNIKPENIVLARTNDKMMIKLADFGVSIDCSSERPVTRCGTLDYISPEALACPDKTHPNDNKDLIELVYGPSVDVWAVGVLAYELIVGLPPFEKDSRRDTRDAILYDEPEFPSTVSSQAKSFILAALNKSAAARATVVDLLKHPWIQKYGRVKSQMIPSLTSELLQAVELTHNGTEPCLSMMNSSRRKEVLTPKSQINLSLLINPSSTSKSFSGPNGSGSTSFRPTKPHSTLHRSPSLLPLISSPSPSSLKKTYSQLDLKSPTSPGLSPSSSCLLSDDLNPGLGPQPSPRFSNRASINRGSFVYPKHNLSSKSPIARPITGHASTSDLTLLHTESSTSSLGSPLFHTVRLAFRGRIRCRCSTAPLRAEPIGPVQHDLGNLSTCQQRSQVLQLPVEA